MTHRRSLRFPTRSPTAGRTGFFWRLIDAGFLGWGRDDEFASKPRIHALAAVEFTASVISLYKKLIVFLQPKPEKLAVHLRIANGKVGDRLLEVLPYRLNTLSWALGEDSYSLTKAHAESDVAVSTADILNDPSKVAFEVVERLFLLFGVPSDRIPYVVESEGVRRIDIDSIVAIR